MMKGGLYIKDGYTSDSAFIYFITYSIVSFLSKGSFGMVIKCTLQSGVVSPYENLRTIYKGKEVRTLIIKFSPLHYNEQFEIVPIDIDIPIYSVPIKSFENEITTQIDIFNKTIDHLDPICPSIVYSKYLDRKLDKKHPHHKHMMGLLMLIISKKDKIINEFLSPLYVNMKKSKNYTFGLIGMEMMDDYVTLHKIKNKDAYECIARLRLIELAIKTGYTHNDYHHGNILVNPNASGYYGKKLGHVLLIDFGYTKKIPNELLETIKELYNKNDFYGILDIFYNDKRLSNTFPNGSGKFNFSAYPDLYSWIISPKQMIDAMNIDAMNKELLSLKNDYETYESVEKNGLDNKKLFTYDVGYEDGEKKDVIPEVKKDFIPEEKKEEEERPSTTNKRKDRITPASDPASDSASATSAKHGGKTKRILKKRKQTQRRRKSVSKGKSKRR